MKKIGLVVAMTKEFDLVKNLMKNKTEKHINGFEFVEGLIGGKEVVLAKSGMGKVCSAVGVLELIKNFKPDCIINTGVAGGIDVTTQVMDIVAADRIVYHDVWCGEPSSYGQIQGMPECFITDRILYEAAIAVNADVNIYGGLICTGDKFITDRQELDVIKSNFPDGLAVDMESCSMAQVCYMYQMPFLSLRIISDTPGVKDHQQQYENFWSEAPVKSLAVIEKLITSL